MEEEDVTRGHLLDVGSDGRSGDEVVKLYFFSSSIRLRKISKCLHLLMLLRVVTAGALSLTLLGNMNLSKLISIVTASITTLDVEWCSAVPNVARLCSN